MNQYKSLFRCKCHCSLYAPPPSRDATQPPMTYRSRFSTAASAIPTFIKCAMNGTRSCPLSTRACLVTKLSVESPRSAPRFPSSRRAISRRSVAWLIPMGLVLSARRAWEVPCDGTLTYNFPDKHLGGVTYGGSSESTSSISGSCCTCPLISIPRESRLSSAPASLPTRRCATGASPRARKSAWSESATRPYGRQVCPCARSPHRGLHHLAQQKRRRSSPRCG